MLMKMAALDSCGVRPSRPSNAGTPLGRSPALLYRPRGVVDKSHRRILPACCALAAAGTLGEEQPISDSLEQALRRARIAVSSPHDKEIASVAFPALVGMAMEPAVSAFNAGLIGHLGTQQLGAVSLATIALNAATYLFSFLLYLTVPETAAAAASGDPDEVSRVTSQSLWVALGCGCVTALTVFLNAGNIVAALKPPEPLVAHLAHQYFQIRALAIPAVLLGFVTTGVFRGFKDTRTPLFGTAASVGVSFVLHVLLLNVFHLDVVGAAVAASLASLSSCTVMVGALLRGGKLQLRHLLRPPPLRTALPLLQRGAVLGTRSMVSFGMILFASAMCARMGSAFQASFEVIRQLWMLSMPFFECISVATQSLCAAALGQEDRATARSLLLRLLTLGVGIGCVAGATVWTLHEPLIAFFSSDPRVVETVVSCLPLICAFFPIDAAGSIMDGSLMAAKQSNYLSAVQIFGSALQYMGLMWIVSTGNVVALNVWLVIKVMSLFRVGGGVVRNFLSPKSAYRIAVGALATATADKSVAAAAVASTTDLVAGGKTHHHHHHHPPPPGSSPASALPAGADGHHGAAAATPSAASIPLTAGVDSRGTSAHQLDSQAAAAAALAAPLPAPVPSR